MNAAGIEQKPCRLHPDKPARSRGLCMACYHKWRRGALPSADMEALTKTETLQEKIALNEAALPDELKDHKKAVPQALVQSGKRLMARFFYNPYRMGVILQQFYDRALLNDKVLVEYVKTIIPRGDPTPPVQVVINAPSITQRDNRTYDVTGEAITDA